MPAEVTCPSCGQRLRIPDEHPGLALTCPRCLAKLAPGVTATPTARGMQPQRVPDVEIRRDTRRIGVGLILLAVLGGLGIAYYFFVAGAIATRGQTDPLLSGFVGLAFLALVGTGLVLWRTRANPAAQGLGRVIIGTLALAGALIAGIFLLWLALIVFILAVCISGRSF